MNVKVRLLLEDLLNQDRERKQRALHEFGALEKDAAVNGLVEALSSQDTNLRCIAAETLLKIDSNRGVDILLPFLESDDSTLRWLICSLLSYYGDKRAVKPLMKVLQQDSEADVRIFAAAALGAIGDVRALPLLKRTQQFDGAVDSQGHRVSDAAEAAVAKIERTRASE